MLRYFLILLAAFSASSFAEEPPVIGARFMDSDGNIHALGDGKAPGEVMLIYFAENCPISAEHIDKLKRLANTMQNNGNYLYGVLLAADEHWPAARAFQKKHRLDFPLFADPSGDLAGRVPLTMPPAAFYYDINGKLLYAGEVNNNLHASLPTSSPQSCPAPVLAGKDKTPTYRRDIAPMIAANCLECHRTNGIAPFPLEQYDIVRAYAPLLKQVTGTRRMPPWKPGPKQSGVFRGERILSEKQIALFADWADAKAPLGDEAVLPMPKLGDVKWRLGKPDLVLSMAESFAVPATGDDVYRYFVLPSGLLEDKTVVGIDFSPGATEVVHHANFFADYSGRARRKDLEDDEQGFSVFGTGEFMSYDNTDEDSFGIGGWAPGVEPYQTPSMAGLWLPKGADIIFEIHYKLSGKATQDKSAIAFYFAERETAEYLDGLLIGTQDLDISPDNSTYRRHFYMQVPSGFRLIDIMPHMHYIGKEALIVATLPSGEKKEIMHIRDWDLAWQNIYAFRKPLYFPAGSRLDAWFVYDNSAGNTRNPHKPPQRIRWGWKSEDEMAEIWMGIIPDDYTQREKLIKASSASWGRSAKP